MKQHNKVRKTFLEGVLKGLTIDTVRFVTGRIYGGGWSGSRYKVTGCKPAEPAEPTQSKPSLNEQAV